MGLNIPHPIYVAGATGWKRPMKPIWAGRNVAPARRVCRMTARRRRGRSVFLPHRQGFYKEVVKEGVLCHSLPPTSAVGYGRYTGIGFERAASDLRRWRDRLEATDELRLGWLNRTPDYDSIGIY
jgi:hypothetical protein